MTLGVLLHVEDLVLPDGDLRADVEEVGGDGEPELRIMAERGEAAVAFGLILVLAGHLGELHAREDEGEDEYGGTDGDVGGDDAHDLGVEIGVVGAGGLLRGDLGGSELNAGEDEGAAEPDAEDGAGRIEHLGEVEAALAGWGRAELGHEGIGGGLKHGAAAAAGEESDEEKRVCAADGGGPEEDHAGAEEGEAHDHAGLVSPAAHDEGGGDGHAEVAEEVGGAYQAARRRWRAQRIFGIAGPGCR